MSKQAQNRSHRPARTSRILSTVVAVYIGLLAWQGVGRADAQPAKQQDPAQRADTVEQVHAVQLYIKAPEQGKDTLVIQIMVYQPYIDQVATRVTYDGMDRIFGIEWKHGSASGRLVVPDSLVTEEQVFTDILDKTNAGVSAPERYTPWTAPRLLPYLLAVRKKWGRQFDDMAYASTKIAVIALVATVRPTTSPLTARAGATPRPSRLRRPALRIL